MAKTAGAMKGGGHGAADVVAMFDDYDKFIPKALNKLFWKWAFKFANHAKEHAPVHDAILKNSIKGEVDSIRDLLVGAYGTNVKHAAHVEFGTKHIKVGTPEQPRTTWPAKEATGTVSPETMPYIRTAWHELHNEFERELAQISKGFKG